MAARSSPTSRCRAGLTRTYRSSVSKTPTPTGDCPTITSSSATASARPASALTLTDASCQESAASTLPNALLDGGGLTAWRRACEPAVAGAARPEGVVGMAGFVRRGSRGCGTSPPPRRSSPGGASCSTGPGRRTSCTGAGTATRTATGGCCTGRSSRRATGGSAARRPGAGAPAPSPGAATARRRVTARPLHGLARRGATAPDQLPEEPAMTSQPLVLAQSNDADQNELHAFRRDARDGSLTHLGAFATKGSGSGAPHLPSQGSVTLTGDGRPPLVTNAGSGDAERLRRLVRERPGSGAGPADRRRAAQRHRARGAGLRAQHRRPLRRRPPRRDGDAYAALPGSRRDAARRRRPRPGRLQPRRHPPRRDPARPRRDPHLPGRRRSGLLGDPVETPSAGPTPYGFALHARGRRWSSPRPSAPGRARRRRPPTWSTAAGRARGLGERAQRAQRDLLGGRPRPTGGHVFTTNFADGAVSHWTGRARRRPRPGRRRGRRHRGRPPRPAGRRPLVRRALPLRPGRRRPRDRTGGPSRPTAACPRSARGARCPRPRRVSPPS